MKLISDHIWWWSVLLVGTVIVSIITSYRVSPSGLLVSVFGHLLFSVSVAAIPWIVYKLVGRPLTTEQMMSTITVGWLILAVANLLVM